MTPLPSTGSPSGPTAQTQQNVGQTAQRAPKGQKILHVKMGIMDMGDGLPPWIPTQQECDDVKKDWEAVTDSDTEVIVTHFSQDSTWL